MFKLWLSGSGVKPSVRVGAAFLLLISLVQLAKADCCTGKSGEVSFNLAKGCGVTVTSSSKVNMSPQAVVDGVYDGENSTVRVLGPGYGIKSGDLEDLAYIKIDLGQNKCIKDLMVFADGRRGLFFVVSVLNHHRPIDFLYSITGPTGLDAQSLHRKDNTVSTFKYENISHYRPKTAMCGRYIFVVDENEELSYSANYDLFDLRLKEIEVHGWEA